MLRLGRVDSEWVKGELYGKVGIFPMTFVEMIEDLPAPTQDGMNEMISSEETKNTTRGYLKKICINGVSG
jgi:hypothetical protein